MESLSPTVLAQELFSLAGIEQDDISSVIGASDRVRAERVVEANCREIARNLGPADSGSADVGRDQIVNELLNQCLTALSITPLPPKVFALMGGAQMLRSSDSLRAAVEKFRKFAAYHFGGFNRGYSSVSGGRVSLEKFEELWRSMYRYENNAAVRALKDSFSTRARLSGIEPVDGDALWALGYLAPEHARSVNQGRQELLPHLTVAQQDGVDSYSALEILIRDRVVKTGRSKPAVDAMVNRANLPDDACLFNVPEGIFGPYRQRLDRATRYCELVSPERIIQLKERGRQNTFVYLTTGEIDVYVATSMRDPEHFTTTAAFTKRLFEHQDVAPLGLRFFDPTQSFCHDRFDKGLLEILMIHRCKITVYHAQERDTFGKDSEASLSLAAGKPVIVYVTRLFSRLPQFASMHAAIDECQKPIDKADVLGTLRSKNLLSHESIDDLAPPEFTKAHIVKAIVDQYARTALEAMPLDEIHGELYIHGYRFPPPHDWEGRSDQERRKLVVDFTVERITALEHRALTFQEGHPLSLQASPFDGVARGVFVARSVDQTAHVLHRILLGTMQYRIKELGYAWALYDEVTNSPIRLVTKDKSMTHAFWTDFRNPVPLGFSREGAV